VQLVHCGAHDPHDGHPNRRRAAALTLRPPAATLW
jgi:hypothetical protein